MLLSQISALEHVHVTVNMDSHTRRGLFSLSLQSPAGTKSTLLAPRPLDNSLTGSCSTHGFL